MHDGLRVLDADAHVVEPSDQSTYTSGSVIPIDGALAARRM